MKCNHGCDAHKTTTDSATKECLTTDRRGWMKQSLGLLLGGIAALIPTAGGLTFFLAPILGKKVTGGQSLKIATLDAIPDDGTPVQIPVHLDRVDAWNKFLDTPVGQIFVRKNEKGTVEVLNASCPHVGCSVQYASKDEGYLCPCHNATFSLTGKRENAISPRDMDSLEVEIKNETEVWINYQDFRPSIPEKIPTT